MIITKEIEIDMGHRVPNHKSKCKNLHGHRYKIEATVDDKVIDTKGASDEGMVIDFSDLKQIMLDVLDTGFDHNSVFYENDPALRSLAGLQKFQDKRIHFVPFIPTAENLAKHWFELLEPKLKKRKIKLFQLKVWETPTSTASYRLLDQGI